MLPNFVSQLECSSYMVQSFGVAPGQQKALGHEAEKVGDVASGSHPVESTERLFQMRNPVF